MLDSAARPAAVALRAWDQHHGTRGSPKGGAAVSQHLSGEGRAAWLSACPENVFLQALRERLWSATALEGMDLPLPRRSTRSAAPKERQHIFLDSKRPWGPGQKGPHTGFRAISARGSSIGTAREAFALS
jgi:hypothetical protein